MACGTLPPGGLRISPLKKEFLDAAAFRNIPGPTSQDAETPSYYGLNPVCYIVNAGGGTRGDSEFRRPEMWAQVTGTGISEANIKFNLYAVFRIRIDFLRIRPCK
jgi:hypothetical protein